VSGPPLAGKVVVVTGATSGIGRATALACSRQGARVMAVGRKDAALESLAEACARWGGEVRSIALDVTEDEAMETIAADSSDAFGRIDAWVNNAAVYAVGRFEQTPPEAFERVLAVNLEAAVRGSRVALAQFRAQGEGVLINVSSMVAGLPGPTVSAYAAAKWGLRGFSLALHAELRDEPGIDVCVVRPASIDTPIFRQTANYSGRRVKALTPTYPPGGCRARHRRLDHQAAARTRRRPLRQGAGRGPASRPRPRRSHLRDPLRARSVRRRRAGRSDRRQRLRAR
jgi:NAD(P)-dependent dehydrogenase (short-subunit alcohol dehydrogenase family)